MKPSDLNGAQNNKHKHGVEAPKTPFSACTKRKIGLKNGKSGKIIFWNKGGSAFQVKKDEIETIICEHNPLAFGLLEANMSQDSHPATLLIDGYKLERDNLMAENIRTRTALYINDDVRYKRRIDLEPKASPIIWVEINNDSNISWLMCLGYREWHTLNKKNRLTSGSVAQQLIRLSSWETSWNNANSENKPIVILSDINVDVSPWLEPHLELTTYQKQQTIIRDKVKEMAENCNLQLIKTTTTRHQGSDKPSILDIILTNCPQTIHQIQLMPSSSDHKIVILKKEIKAIKATTEIRFTRSFKNYSKEKLLNHINIPMLNSLLMQSDPNLIANVLCAHITEAIDKVAPFKKVQRRFK